MPDELRARGLVIARVNRNFAGFNRITVDADGNPDEGDPRRCWKEGARVLRLTSSALSVV